ncbi:MAG: T9SS type A sorting domain-containing protein [Cytophagales bacterium]|nr:T9SS type A sorting domain-containing protein [Cytophagales bacterium]
MRVLSFCLIVFFIFSTVKGSRAQQDPVDLYISNSVETTGTIGNLEIKVNNFSDILSFQASINWDPDLLVFVGVTDFGIKDFGDDNFGTSDADKGHVRFAWEPSDAISLSIDDSSTLFIVQFEFISAQPQKVPVSFTDITSDPAFPIEFANSEHEILGVNTHDGSITFFDEITALEELYHAGINIYPNPFVKSINISNDEGKLDFIQVLNIHGEKINEIYNIKNKFIDLHLSGSSDGVYLINISKNGKLFTRKVVKIPSK